MATYDDNGGYGHPDHIQTHRVTMRAVELAADPAFRPDLGAAWDVPKVYENVVPRSFLQQGMDAMKEAGVDFFGVENVDDLPFGVPDEMATAKVDARTFEPQKMKALAAHATQVEVDGPFFALSNHVGLAGLGLRVLPARARASRRSRTTRTAARRPCSTASSDPARPPLARFCW